MDYERLAEIMFETTKDLYKKSVENICKEYEADKKYHVIKIRENGEIVGFGVYFDTPEYRMLEGGYGVFKDKLTFFREIRKTMKGAKVIRTTVWKSNTPMLNFYTKIGFKIISEDRINIYFEKRGE